jgi:sugar (pentulose or hexulose) kinase
MIRALGIDIGASGVGAAIVDATESVFADAVAPFTPSRARRARDEAPRATLRGIARSPSLARANR